MLLTVVIPTYRRPDYLAKCLEGIAAQIRSADEVLVAVREDDSDTLSMLTRWETLLPLHRVMINKPGVTAAQNAAAAVARGHILSLTDDDAVPQPDWLARIETTFAADPAIGALGGMDILRSGGDIPTAYTTQVGIITPYGRVLGNHHRGAGNLRPVEHLKGVNLSWRADAAGPQPFVTDFRGLGAQVFWEFAFCLRLAREGWKVMYDPTILVDHYVAVRFDEDNRAKRTVSAQANAAHNFHIALTREHRRGWKRTAAMLWAYFVGEREMPGMLRHGYFTLTRNHRGVEIARATRRARTTALGKLSSDKLTIKTAALGYASRSECKAHIDAGAGSTSKT